MQSTNLRGPDALRTIRAGNTSMPPSGSLRTRRDACAAPDRLLLPDTSVGRWPHLGSVGGGAVLATIEKPVNHLSLSWDPFGEAKPGGNDRGRAQ
jgi:hypothetical protein